MPGIESKKSLELIRCGQCGESLGASLFTRDKEKKICDGCLFKKSGF